MTNEVVGAAGTEDHAAAPPAPLLERAVAAVVIVLGSAMLIGARGIGVRNETGGIDPRWWPTVIAVGILAMGVWMLCNAVFTGIERTVDPAQRSGWVSVLATVAGLVVMLAAWILGVPFLILAPLFLIGTNWVYGLRRWTTLLLFPAIVTLLIYLIFRLMLKVAL